MLFLIASFSLCIIFVIWCHEIPASHVCPRVSSSFVCFYFSGPVINTRGNSLDIFREGQCLRGDALSYPF